MADIDLGVYCSVCGSYMNTSSSEVFEGNQIRIEVWCPKCEPERQSLKVAFNQLLKDIRENKI